MSEGKQRKALTLSRLGKCTYHARACFFYNIETFFIRFILNPLGSHTSLQDFICFPHVTVILLSLVSSSNLKQCPTLPQLPYCIHSVQLYDHVSLSSTLCFVTLSVCMYVWFDMKPVTPLSFSWSPCVALLLHIKHVVYLIVINHGSIETNFFKSSGCFMFEPLTLLITYCWLFPINKCMLPLSPFQLSLHNAD